MDRNDNAVSGWVGWIFFAGLMMVIGGIFRLVAGLIAILNQSYYAVSGSHATVVFSINTWGWIDVIVGALILAAGFAVFSGKTWARIVAVIVATISLIANLLFAGVYPIWAISAVVIDALVLYALIVHGGELKDA